LLLREYDTGADSQEHKRSDQQHSCSAHPVSPSLSACWVLYGSVRPG
jgi:hypothetical protein